MRSLVVLFLTTLSTTHALSCYGGQGNSYTSSPCSTTGLAPGEAQFCIKVTNGDTVMRSCPSDGLSCSSEVCIYDGAGNAFCCCGSDNCNVTVANSPFVSFAAIILFTLYLLK